VTPPQRPEWVWSPNQETDDDAPEADGLDADGDDDTDGDDDGGTS
jgi:hypothetical protein